MAQRPPRVPLTKKQKYPSLSLYESFYLVDGYATSSDDEEVGYTDNTIEALKKNQHLVYEDRNTRYPQAPFCTQINLYNGKHKEEIKEEFENALNGRDKALVSLVSTHNGDPLHAEAVLLLRIDKKKYIVPLRNFDIDIPEMDSSWEIRPLLNSINDRGQELDIQHKGGLDCFFISILSILTMSPKIIEGIELKIKNNQAITVPELSWYSQSMRWALAQQSDILPKPNDDVFKQMLALRVSDSVENKVIYPMLENAMDRALHAVYYPASDYKRNILFFNAIRRALQDEDIKAQIEDIKNIYQQCAVGILEKIINISSEKNWFVEMLSNSEPLVNNADLKPLQQKILLVLNNIANKALLSESLKPYDIEKLNIKEKLTNNLAEEPKITKGLNALLHSAISDAGKKQLQIFAPSLAKTINLNQVQSDATLGSSTTHNTHINSKAFKKIASATRAGKY